MPKRARHTKILIIIGFLLVAGSAVTGMVFIYQKWVEINQITGYIENPEFQQILQFASEIISAIGLLSLASILLFLFLAFRTITRNRRYRRELEKSIRQIKNLSAARERLILTITHDIKSPLSSIIGFIELLHKSKLPEKEKYYLENMQHSSEHVLQLVRNLLDYHVLEADAQAIKLMPFLPYVLLNDIYQSFVPLADKKKLNFQFYYDDNIEKAKISYISDPYRIRQIVGNILSNAIKFTPVGGMVLFTVSISKQDNQHRILFSVKDNGPGIDREDHKRIFEEFRRLKNPEQRIDGSGLGLAIAEKLTQLLKGTITINSTVGEGSEFIICIPIEKSNDKFSLPVIPKHQKIPFNVKRDKKIMFIDDDFIQLNLLSELLKQERLVPTTCDNSTDALKFLRKERFDIIFTDIQMPNMNGFELVELIRKDASYGCSSIPIIAVSANSDIPDADYIRAGFSGFLPKPFTSNQTLSEIQKFIGEDPNGHLIKTTESKGFYALCSFAGDDVEAGAEIIRSFIVENKRNIVWLKMAFKDNDKEAVRGICHKMLPLMRMISADDAVHFLSEFEKGNFIKERKSELIKAIETQIRKAEAFLKSKLQSNKEIS